MSTFDHVWGENQRGGGPAFPAKRIAGKELMGGADIVGHHPGMTLRDYFASKALPAILAQDGSGITAYAPGSKFGNGRTAAQEWAAHAYEIADAMLEAREAK